MGAFPQERGGAPPDRHLDELFQHLTEAGGAAKVSVSDLRVDLDIPATLLALPETNARATKCGGIEKV